MEHGGDTVFKVMFKIHFRPFRFILVKKSFLGGPQFLQVFDISRLFSKSAQIVKLRVFSHVLVNS